MQCCYTEVITKVFNVINSVVVISKNPLYDSGVVYYVYSRQVHPSA